MGAPHFGERPFANYYYEEKLLDDLLSILDHNTLILCVHFLAGEIVGRWVAVGLMSALGEAMPVLTLGNK